MEKWVFWLQFAIIIILLSVILVRDKGVKDFIKNIFSWAKKKIRIAKLKSALNGALDNKKKLIPRLGEIYWKTGIKENLGNDIVSKLDSLKEEENLINKSLNQISINIKEDKENKEKLLNEKNNKLNSYINSKRPLEIELKKIEKEYESVDKSIKEQNKLITKIKNNIIVNNKEKKKIEADPPGYSTENEKKAKTAELDKKNNNLNSELKNIESKIEELRSENPTAKKRVDELNASISEFNLNINTIKDEVNILKKQSEDENKKLETDKRQLDLDLKSKINESKKYCKNLGYIIIEERLEIPQLQDIYSQIDTIEKTIATLKKKLVKINKDENN